MAKLKLAEQVIAAVDDVMRKTWHSTKASVVYHFWEHCPFGNSIKKENRAEGIGDDRRRCAVCCICLAT